MTAAIAIYALSCLVTVPVAFMVVSHNVPLTEREDFIITGAGALIFGVLWLPFLPVFILLPIVYVLGRFLLPVLYVLGRFLNRAVNR